MQFLGVIAAFVANKNNTILFKTTKFNICIIGFPVGIALLSLLPFLHADGVLLYIVSRGGGKLNSLLDNQ